MSSDEFKARWAVVDDARDGFAVGLASAGDVGVRCGGLAGRGEEKGRMRCLRSNPEVVSEGGHAGRLMLLRFVSWDGEEN